MNSIKENELARELDAVRQELRTAQAHLVAAARHAANAGLAHSLTHEINNALTPIIGNAQILALLDAQNPETVERTGQIIANARRIAGWTATLRQLVSDDKREAIEYSFNGLAREVVEFFAERFQRLGIATQLDLDAALPVLRGNPDEIQQVLMLLLQNAIEAMPQGGRISMQTKYDVAGEQVVVTLTNSGVGIAQEQAEHLTEPRLTTPQEPLDTPAGWSLFTSQQIVWAHAGSLEIASPASAGADSTTIRLRLPLQNQVVT